LPPLTLTPGTRLGPYEILSALGAGGMGEVYRATDTNLKRQVAIKVLPQAVAADPERLARFQREAEVLAALNHPNIAHIHGLEKSSGAIALVMELVEGPTLADRIAQGPIALTDALPIAKQLAEALEAAHEQGIIHRDLKPANIKVREDGTVKVLDFGLATALARPDDESASGPSTLALTNSPTLMSPVGVTGVGMILGTAAYMAPEQAKGKPVSKATDIWAFGCVLYEMLTARAVFAGGDLTEVLAAVVRADPDWTALPASTPREIRMVLRNCLHKDQRKRWQDASSLRIAAVDAVEASPDPAVGAHHGRPHANRRLMLVAGLTGLVAAAVSGLAVWSLRPDATPLPTTRLLAGIAPAQINGIGPPGARPTRTAFALSPDGQRLVFVGLQDGRTRLHLRRLDRLEEAPIAGTDGADSPFFSPDGRWIGFWQAPSGAARAEIKKVPVDGGPAITLCPAPLLGGVSWGAHGRIVFAVHLGGDGLWQVSEDGGKPERLTTVDTAKGEFSHRLPQVLPGGEAVLFIRQKAFARFDDADIVVRSLVTGLETVVVQGAADARYVTSGHLVYARMGALLAQPFDLSRLAVSGGPVGVLDDVMHDVDNSLTAGNSGAAQFSVSSSGALAYLPGGVTPAPLFSLVWVNRRGAVERAIPRPINSIYTRLSPDEKRILLGTSIYDLTRDTLTSLPGNSLRLPIWQPDGLRLTGARDAAERELFWIPADGSGAAEPLPTTERGVPMSWSPDGKTLAYLKGRNRFEAGNTSDSRWTSGSSEIWLLSLSGGNAPAVARRLVPGPVQNGRAQFSPDGRYLAYELEQSGRTEVFVQPVSGAGGRITISSNGGSMAAWAGYGRELFYWEPGRDGTTRIMTVEVTLGESFSAGVPRPLFEFRSAEYPAGVSPIRPYDVTRDGTRFLMARRSAESVEQPITQLVLVQNWLEELKRLVPTK
jgi:Tol biopolymer transport system component